MGTRATGTCELGAGYLLYTALPFTQQLPLVEGLLHTEEPFPRRSYLWYIAFSMMGLGKSSTCATHRERLGRIDNFAHWG